jgi:response regulator RpfG family c-di-GMP phosphodiesterase
MDKDERILVVDDEIVIRELLFDILSDDGFAVELAPNGKVALDMLQRDNDFAVLFTDINMPEMDGIALIRESRKVSPALVPIVMTGYGTLETARAAVREGAYDYVLKPFNISEVRLAISNALDRRRLADENARLLEITELFNISESIASIRDEKRLLHFILQAALERVEAVRGSLMVVSPDGRQLRVACSVGLPDDFNDSVVDIDKSISGMVAQNVQPLLMPDIRDDPNITAISQRLRHDSFISVPLERKASPMDGGLPEDSKESKVIAVLNITGKRNNRSFTESDLKILSIVANHAGAALENVRLFRDIEDAQREIIFTLGEIVETRSRETGHHVKRVAELSKLMAFKSGLNPAEAEVLRLASPLHDVGKVGIPDAILNKPGKLTKEEYEIIKTHSQIGHDMLKNAKGHILQAATIIAQQHHERWDGKGYPEGRKAEEIHIYGRITGIADVFDALGADRVYKKAWSLDKIIEHFKAERGYQFDPHLVTVLLDNLDDVLRIRDAFPEEALA